MAALRAANAYVVKVAAGGFKNQEGKFIQLAPAGTTDLLCGRPDGLFGAVEAKRPLGYLSYKQRLTLRDLHKRGLCYAVMDDPSEVETWLKDKSWHGKERWIKQIWSEVTPSSKPVIPTGLAGTPYEGLKQVAEAKRRAFEESIGEAPF